MGHLYHSIVLSTVLALGVIPARAGSSPSTHKFRPAYLALDIAVRASTNFEVIGTSLVSAQQVQCLLPVMS